MDLSIGVVSYNTREVIVPCLASLFKHVPSAELEVIVVDNASSDGSADEIARRFSQIHLIRNSVNRMFTGGYNQAYRAATGRYFLILNPDVEFRDDILTRMMSYLDAHPKCGALSARMMTSNGQLQMICSAHYSLELAFYNFTFVGKIFPERARRLREQTMYAQWDRQSSRPVDVIPDSFFMLRCTAISTGDVLYDEEMGLYFTENDLCKRIQNGRWGVNYLAEGNVIHFESQSVNKADPAFIAHIYRKDITHYFRKYSGIVAAFSLRIGIELTRVGIWIFRLFGVRFKPNLVWGIR